jgi:hypothetical protein
MTAPLGFLPQILKLLGQPFALRLSLHHKATIPGSATVVRESKEGERRTSNCQISWMTKVRRRGFD